MIKRLAAKVAADMLTAIIIVAVAEAASWVFLKIDLAKEPKGYR